MARQLRLEFPGGLYHLTARGNAQAAIFVDDIDRKRFLDLLRREVEQQGWLLHRSANLSIKEAVDLFEVSPSRISHLQRSIDTGRLSPLQRKAANQCKVKQ